MPRTVEHLVEMHELATQRRTKGRPVWARTVNVRAPFNNTDLSFVERREAIVAAIRASSWFREADEYSDLEDAVWRLADAADPNDFDATWDEIYDLADYDRVWIQTR